MNDTGMQRAPRRAWRSPLAWIVLIAVFGAGLSLDLWLKRWSFWSVAPMAVTTEMMREPDFQIPPHNPVVVVPGVLNLHLVKNEGAVFGIGANQRVFFIVFTMAALTAAVAVFARWTTESTRSAHVAIALILAGGFGNLFDRLQFGFVRDYLHMLPGWKLPFGISWPGGSDEIFPWVFNLADVMLLMGMGTLMIYMNAVEKRRKTAQAAAAPGKIGTSTNW